MNNLKYISVLILLILTSCGGTKTASRGLTNESYLEFIGKPSYYSEGVQVVVDENIPFVAKVYNDRVGRLRGEVYAISTGSHNLKVYFENKLIYNKQIFITTQESKKIILP